MPPPPKKKLRKPDAASPADAKDLERAKRLEQTIQGDWRSANWARRHSHALQNDLLCDVTFEVGPEGGHRRSFRAHRLILALASPVFEAMFYGSLAETGPTVHITDITPKGFEALLKYIYSGESFSTYPIETLLQLWVAADKYCVFQVHADSLAHFARVRMGPHNCWPTLEAALFLGIEELAQRAKDYMAKETTEALKGEGYLTVNAETMAAFLNLNVVCAEEAAMLKALVKWGRAQKGESLKETLEPCIKFIRFGALKSLEFCQFLDTGKEALSDADGIAIFKHLTRPRIYRLPEWCSTKCCRRRPQNREKPAFSSDSPSTDSSETSSSSSSSSGAESTDYQHYAQLRRSLYEEPPRNRSEQRMPSFSAALNRGGN